MPELPEVETVRIGLSQLLLGRRIEGVWHDWPKGFPNVKEDVDAFLVGATVVEVKRRAKVLLIELDTKYSLVIHLKMTGQLVFHGEILVPDTHLDGVQGASEQRTEPYIKYGEGAVELATQQSAKNAGQESGSAARQAGTVRVPVRFGAGHPNDSLVGDLPDKTTRVIFDLGDSKLFFNDQRKFGWVRLLPTAEVPNIDFFKKVGPEPLASDFTEDDFRERLMRRKNSSVKAVLLDQTVVAGVGNIYADESLWAARIHPVTLVRDISTRKLNTLYTELREVLELSIEKGGSSDKNYVNAEGKRGSYLNFANVFRREGQPCNRCGTEIIKSRVAGRGTHTCPHCQQRK